MTTETQTAAPTVAAANTRQAMTAANFGKQTTSENDQRAAERACLRVMRYLQHPTQLVVGVCGALHNSGRYGHPVVDEQTQTDMRAFLTRRLERFTDRYAPARDAYAAAVKALIEATLAETP